MYPVTIVDNFFPEPDKIVEISNSYSFERDPIGNWPGERTQCISELNKDLFLYIGNKLHNLFYENNPSWSMEMFFQKTVPCAKNKKEQHNLYNHGWIHDDFSSHFGGVIYLTKNPDEDTGTSIYNLKNGYFNQDVKSIEIKNKFFRGEEVCPHEYAQHFSKVRSQYEKTLTVDNVYNRMLLFGPHVHHGVQTFGYSKPRLTIAFFAKNLSGSIQPLVRINQ